ncbi:DUF5129 domain-containing protein [Corynebacterium halotolerans]|uniref:DUF5129 domain-containing protein n=1 Tax=Corynebacterium halotolerans YIM 70093 = DSM 44683 TaxID=1121362 RepID=M1N125_9CORY|nr:DUF5129 domain-containing protein [Corynebacterium halotolerans]AGF73624.1 hypothetical protein A605_13140 [Corynebacterium halotolerans YIM 70093 = DSM 44683]
MKRITNRAAATVAVAALATVAPGALAPALADALLSPAVPAATVVAQAPAEEAPRVEVIDPSEQLSGEDITLLEEQTPEVDLPAQVERVVYVVFEDNDDNLNDTVLGHAREQRPDLVNQAGDKWAPGLLIVALGLGPDRMGVYCGDDVCSATDIYGEGRLDGILDEMEEPLQQGNWAAGLLRGVQAAADPEVRREESGLPAVVGIALGVGAAAIGGGVAGVAVAASRRKKARVARERFDEVQRDYGRVATELTAIDVSAHSLTSPLANDRLRAQWEEVKNGFLGLHGTMDTLEELSADSTDKEFRERAESIGEAHEKMMRLRTAEDNIGELVRMERGDAGVRRRQLTELHEDVLAATVHAGDGELESRLSALDAGLLDLRERLDAPTFMDEYAGLLGDYRVLVEEVRNRLYSESGTEMGEDHETPRLWESSWRPGYGYGNFVPFAVVNTWHDNDVATAQSASSPSATTGYSAGGFSGGGGSRGF